MPPLYRLVEVGIYSLLNFLPLMVLALYPFRHRLRFSKTATVGLVVALSLVQIFLGWQAAFFRSAKCSQHPALCGFLLFRCEGQGRQNRLHTASAFK